MGLGRRYTAREITFLLRAVMDRITYLQRQPNAADDREVYTLLQLLERITVEQPRPEPSERRQGASPMRLEPDDYELSRKVSRRPRADDTEQLRSLLVHRLTVTMKAVMRRPLQPPRRVSMYCEECDKWFDSGAFPEVTQCPGCSNVYRLEFAVYEQVERADLDER